MRRETGLRLHVAGEDRRLFAVAHTLITDAVCRLTDGEGEMARWLVADLGLLLDIKDELDAASISSPDLNILLYRLAGLRDRLDADTDAE